MRVLALDIATRCGVAVGEAGGTPRAWSFDLGKAPDDRRFSRLLVATSKLLAEHAPDLVAIEAPVGGAKTSHYLVGLAACVRGCAWNRGIPLTSCHIDTVRKHFTGRAWARRDFPGLKPAAARKAVKGKVVERCRLLGWRVDDDDAADAAAVWDYACAIHGRAQAAPSGGLFAPKEKPPAL